MNDYLEIVVIFGCIVVAVGAVLMVIKDLFFPKKERVLRLRDTVRSIPRTDSEKRSITGRIDHWFERTVYLSGLRISAMTATLLLVMVALALGGIMFVLTENVTLTIVVSVIGTVVVLSWLEITKRRRLQAFERQFPAALNLLSRSIRAGESLDQGIELVASASKDLVATEFLRCSKQLEMGLSVPATMDSLTHRIDLMDVRIFSNTLSVHRQTGGNLPETLDRLSAVIRDRHEYTRQIKSVTSAGRFSVMLVLALGPLLFMYMFLFQPEYGKSLWNDPLGRMLLLFAVASQLIGVVWVMRVLKRDY